MNTHLSDSPADLQALAETVRELNACTCTGRPETYSLPTYQWHLAATAGLAECIVRDHERGWATGEETYRHLRWHLNGGK